MRDRIFITNGYLYYPALHVTPSIINCWPLHYNVFKYDFTHCNYNVIKSQLSFINWLAIFKINV